MILKGLVLCVSRGPVGRSHRFWVPMVSGLLRLVVGLLVVDLLDLLGDRILCLVHWQCLHLLLVWVALLGNHGI